MSVLVLIAIVTLATLAKLAAGESLAKAQYFALLDEHHAVDSNRALSRAWDVLQYYWRQLVLDRDQVYLMQPWREPLNQTQEQALLQRLLVQGWHATIRPARVTQAQCAVDGNRCRCRVTAIDGSTLCGNFLGVPNECIRYGRRDGPDANLFVSLYCDTQRELWVEPRASHWNGTHYDALHTDEFYDSFRDAARFHYDLGRYTVNYEFVAQARQFQSEYRERCEHAPMHSLPPVRLLLLETFSDAV